MMVLARREASKNAELLVLRHENALLRRQIGRVRYQPADRLWLAALSRLIPRRRWGEVFAGDPGNAAYLAAAAGHPQMGLHEPTASRQAVHGSRNPEARHPHRDRQPDLCGAQHFHDWGYQRIQGELLKLGHRVSASTVRRVLKTLKIPPAPKRHTDATWRQFLHTQAPTMLAADFFHVDCAVTLQRLYCLFVMDIGSRYVHILGVTANPDGPWTVQQIRNLLMDLGNRAADFRFLVRDWAGQFTVSFNAVLADAGIEAVKIPPRSPCANAYAERFVLTARTEVTDRMLIFGERHLLLVLAEYEAHYNGRRPHRSLQLQPPRPDHPVADLSRKRIKRRPVLGGLISEYERAA